MSVTEAERLLMAVYERPYTVEWELGGNIDANGNDNWMLADTKGRAGIMPSGDRFVQLTYSGFVHLGNQAWYLMANPDGSWRSEGPETGFLHQRPGIQAWERIKPEKLSVLDAIWRHRETFRRAPLQSGVEIWTSAVPPRKSAVELFGSYRVILDFSITVRKFDEVNLPVKFHFTWWDSGRVVTFDGTYDWSPPVFPQVSDKNTEEEKPGG